MLERIERKRDPCTLLVGIKLVQPLCEPVWRFLKKLKIEHIIQQSQSWAYTRRNHTSIRHMHHNFHRSTSQDREAT